MTAARTLRTLTLASLPILTLIGLAAAPAAQPGELDRFRIDAGRSLTHVRVLSADELAGRGNGEPGLRRAADYIAEQFAAAGLAGGGDGGSHRQAIAGAAALENIVGILPGSDPSRRGEGVVIGAHYDHLGTSRSPQGDAIYNGADDNASGTAMVIEMAHAAARQRAAFSRSLVFVAFAGEEVDLLGSRQYVRQPPAAVRRTVAMLNLDMVGRAHGRVMVGGTGVTTALSATLHELQGLTALRVDDFRDGYGAGASDNDPFEQAGVPTLLFFTGFHAEYHRPTDDWDRIDAAGAAEIARLALALAARLSSAEGSADGRPPPE